MLVKNSGYQKLMVYDKTQKERNSNAQETLWL